MSLPEANGSSLSASAGQFATTRWSVVLAAGEGESPESREALAALCTSYWYPLYAFVRRRGCHADQAQDLTQEFFARLLEKNYLQVVERGKGKFRSFLLAAFQHFLSNERDREQAQKRGGGVRHLSIDFHGAEQRYGLEPAHTLTPERLFERRWALTLLDQVVARLREEFILADKARTFEHLKLFLTGEKSAIPYSQLADKLGLSEGAVKVAVHRLRRRYRELLREEIARTLDDASQVEDEIRDLFTALGAC